MKQWFAAKDTWRSPEPFMIRWVRGADSFYSDTNISSLRTPHVIIVTAQSIIIRFTCFDYNKWIHISDHSVEHVLLPPRAPTSRIVGQPTCKQVCLVSVYFKCIITALVAVVSAR